MMGEIEAAPRRMTASHKGQLCCYCKNTLPDETVGNPTWPWKMVVGKSSAVCCSRPCLEWYRYKLVLKRVVGTMKTRHYSEQQIEDKVQLYREDCAKKGTLPRDPDPREGIQEQPEQVLVLKKAKKDYKASAELVPVNVDEYAKEEKPVEISSEEARDLIEAYIERETAVEKPAEPVEKSEAKKPARLIRHSVAEEIRGRFVSMVIDRREDDQLIDSIDINTYAVNSGDYVDLAEELEELGAVIREVFDSCSRRP